MLDVPGLGFLFFRLFHQGLEAFLALFFTAKRSHNFLRKFRHTALSHGWLGRKCLRQGGIYSKGDLGIFFEQRNFWALVDVIKGFFSCPTSKYINTRQGLSQNNSKRENISALVNKHAFNLFWRHVAHRTSASTAITSS